jgi:hypothetical protein
MRSASRKSRGRLEGAQERASAKTFARGAPGRVRRAVLRVRRTGPEDLRRNVEVGLKNGMELDILRHGKRETVKVEPLSSSSK